MGILSNHINLNQKVIVKAPGLLPMKYTLNEIAEKLEINPRTLSDWTDAGAPHEHDSRGYIWVVGTEFAQWVEQVRLQKKKASGNIKLGDTEAYCMRCKKPVDLNSPVIVSGTGKQFFIKGICPHCGCKINRGGRKNDSA
jgi:hypothetical protein